MRADLERNLDAIEDLVAGREYLLGAGPYLCDFALVAQLVYLTLALATKRALDDRRGCRALVARVPCGPSFERPRIGALHAPPCCSPADLGAGRRDVRPARGPRDVPALPGREARGAPAPAGTRSTAQAP